MFLNWPFFSSLSNVLDADCIVKVKNDRITILKLPVIFCKQKAPSIYSGDDICYQFNPKIEIENEGENYRKNIQVD